MTTINITKEPISAFMTKRAASDVYKSPICVELINDDDLCEADIT